MNPLESYETCRGLCQYGRQGSNQEAVREAIFCAQGRGGFGKPNGRWSLVVGLPTAAASEASVWRRWGYSSGGTVSPFTCNTRGAPSPSCSTLMRAGEISRRITKSTGIPMTYSRIARSVSACDTMATT